jgi:hypothetical protein
MSTDPRVHAWQQRKIAVERVALLRMYRASCCCCSRCKDDDKAEELDSLIARTLEQIAELNDRICTLVQV